MIRYYCDICKKDITGERKYKLRIETIFEICPDEDKTICKSCLTRITTYINKELRVTNNK